MATSMHAVYIRSKLLYDKVAREEEPEIKTVNFGENHC